MEICFAEDLASAFFFYRSAILLMIINSKDLNSDSPSLFLTSVKRLAANGGSF